MDDMSDDSSSDNRSLDDESSDVSSVCSSSGKSNETGYPSLYYHSISTDTASTGNYSLNSEASNKNSNEWINSELDSLEKYSDFKINGSVIDKNRNHLQSTDSSIDSNRQPENDAKLCGKKPQERNTGVNKPGNSVEVTNPINPTKLFGAHQGDSAVPKAEDVSSVEIGVFEKLADYLGILSAKVLLGDLLSYIPLSKHSGDNTFQKKYFDEDPDYKAVISTIVNSLESSPVISDDNSRSSDKMTACWTFLMALMTYYHSKFSMVDGTDNEVEDNEENAHWNDGLNSDENPGRWDLLTALSKLKIAPEAILGLYSVKKGVYGDVFSKIFTDGIKLDQTWHSEDVVVAMAHLQTSKSYHKAEDDGSSNEEDTEENGDHDNGGANNFGENQQSVDPLPAVCSQPHMVECTEAVDTSGPSELVQSQSSTMLQSHKELIAKYIELLSSMISRGGQITSVSPTQVTIVIHGQKLVLTTDNSFYKECLRKGDGVTFPSFVARHRDYLTAWNIPYTATMINNTPTVVALLLLPPSSDDSTLGDIANELIRRSQKDAFMSKIRRIRNNNDDESVTLVSEMDPESDHSVKENAVLVPNRKNASNLEINCTAKQVSSASVDSATSIFNSSQVCANETEEKLIVTHRFLLRPNMFMELHDLVDQLVSPQFQELRYLIHRSLHEDPEFYSLFVQTLMGQAHLAEPQCAVETVPTVYVQGPGIIPTLLDGSDPDHEKFSRTYNMPYNFSPPSFGEPYPLPCYITEDNAETTNSFPVNSTAIPASDANHSDKSSNAEFGHKDISVGSGQKSMIHRLPHIIQQLISQCHGLEQNLEFHDLFAQLMCQQNQPCVVHTLPVINMGVINVAQGMISDSDNNDPEQWSKAYKAPETFLPPPCGEPDLPNFSLDSSDDHAVVQQVTCDAQPTSDDQVLSSSVSEDGSERLDNLTSTNARDSMENSEKFIDYDATMGII